MKMPLSEYLIHRAEQATARKRFSHRLLIITPQLRHRVVTSPSFPINTNIKWIESKQDEMVSYIYKFISKFDGFKSHSGELSITTSIYIYTSIYTYRYIHIYVYIYIYIYR